MKKKWIKKIFDFDALVNTILVFTVLMFLPIIFSIDFLNPIASTVEEVSVSDIVVSQKHQVNDIETDTNIVLVNIGNLNRKEIAEQINILNKYNPKIIGIDSFFRNPKEEDTDSLLMLALSNIKNLVMVSELSRFNTDTDSWDTLVKSNPMFTKYAETGYANISIDLENTNSKTARVFTLRQSTKSGEEKSFPLTIAEIAYPNSIHKLIKRNNEKESISFRRNIDKYIHLDAYEVLADTFNSKIIENKIVLIGFLGSTLGADELEDRWFSPMNSKIIGKSFPDIYGLIVHANVLSQIRDDEYIHSVEPKFIVLFTAIIVYLNMLFLKKIHNQLTLLYEPVSLLTVFAELFGLLIIVLFVFDYLNIDIVLKETFIAVGICPTIFETYNSSIKEYLLKRKLTAKESKV